MQDILPIFSSTFKNRKTNSIDARKLHEFLVVKSKFATWIQNRIEKYAFAENIDFVSVSIFLENGGRSIEYAISIEMAKELSMVENNLKGREARLYFIKKEEEANNQIQAPQLPTNYIEALKYLIKSEECKIELENLIAEQKITIEVQDYTIEKISNIQDTYSLREACYNLLVKQCQLKDFLKSKKWIQYLSDGGEGKKMYSTAYSKSNNFATDATPFSKARNRYFHQFRITKHGMAYLIKKREDILKNEFVCDK